jgi:DnaJ-class molecular chaperone
MSEHPTDLERLDELVVPADEVTLAAEDEERQCPDCRGAGVTAAADTCSTCEGTGAVLEEMG